MPNGLYTDQNYLKNYWKFCNGFIGLKNSLKSIIKMRHGLFTHQNVVIYGNDEWDGDHGKANASSDGRQSPDSERAGLRKLAQSRLH